MPQPDIQAVIFDMDGLLIDSEHHWPQVEGLVWPKLGVDFNDELRNDILGLKLGDILNVVRKKYGVHISDKKAHELFLIGAQEVYLKRSQLLPGASELLVFLHKRDIPMGLASSSPFSWIDMFLDRFSFRSFFRYVFSTESMKLPGKPDPTIYLRIMEKLSVPAASCLVLEDSPHGVESGKRSGAYVVAVPHRDTPLEKVSQADMIVSSLTDEKIKQLFYA